MKTLKDIETRLPERGGIYTLVNGNRLREVAREELKNHGKYSETAKFIKEFFNLEDENVK